MSVCVCMRANSYVCLHNILDAIVRVRLITRCYWVKRRSRLPPGAFAGGLAGHKFLCRLYVCPGDYWSKCGDFLVLFTLQFSLETFVFILCSQINKM